VDFQRLCIFGLYGAIQILLLLLLLLLLLVLIELFSLGVTTEALRVSIGSKAAISLQRGLVDPKFQVEGVALHQPFFF